MKVGGLARVTGVWVSGENIEQGDRRKRLIHWLRRKGKRNVRFRSQNISRLN